MATGKTTASKTRAKSGTKAKTAKKTKGKNSGKPRMTKARVREAIKTSRGLKTIAAKLLNISRQTLYNYIERWPDLQDAFDEVDEELGDFAEGELLKLIRAGDSSAIRFYLRTKHKHRGYTERTEVTGEGGGPVQTQQKVDLSQCSDEELAILMNGAKEREQNTAEG